MHNTYEFTFTVVTETWLTAPIANKFEGIIVAQSPPNAHQGILILTSSKVRRINPVLSDFWTPTTIAAIFTIVDEGKATEALVIAHYSPPLMQETTDKELQFKSQMQRADT